MSPVIYTPPERHNCVPPVGRPYFTGANDLALQVDTIWACDECGQRWIVAGENYGAPTNAGHAVRHSYERRYWVRHDKDTP